MEKKKGPGRPTKLTEELKRGILIALEAAGPVKTAAEVNGIDYETLRRWLKDPRHEDFAAECKKAQESVKMRLLRVQHAIINDEAAPPRDRIMATQWLLERIDRKNFGYKSTIEVETVEASQVTPQKAAELMREQFGSVGPELGEQSDDGEGED